MNRPSGIADLRGREPIGAVLTIGHKGDRGFPTDTDRLFIVQTTMDEKNVRPPHPLFGAFNKAPPERRQSLCGNIVHATREQCFEMHLKAQILSSERWPNHPDKRPACVGDGVTAERFYGQHFDDYRPVEGCGPQCEFRQGDRPDCKPWLRFCFRPRWVAGSPIPSPLMKYTSGSWNTASNFLGFFEYIDQQARLLGVQEYSLFGLPFMMTLSRKTKASQKKSFPVMSIATDGDLQEFLWTQSERFKALGGGALAALTDKSQQGEEEYADLVTIEPGLPRKDS